MVPYAHVHPLNPKRTNTNIPIESKRYQWSPGQCEYSGPKRPPIPVEAGHPFRLKAATHSGETGHSLRRSVDSDN